MKKLATVLAFLFLLGCFGCEEIDQEPEVEAMEQALGKTGYSYYYRVLDKSSYWYGETGRFVEYDNFSRLPVKLYFEFRSIVVGFETDQVEPKPNEYFTQDKEQVPLVDDHFSSIDDLEDL